MCCPCDTPSRAAVWEERSEKVVDQDSVTFFEEKQHQRYKDGKWIFPLCIFYS